MLIYIQNFLLNFSIWSSHFDLNWPLILFSGAFEDENVTHVEGEVNPVRDLDIISEELRLKDEEYLNSNLEKLERTVVRGNDKKLKPEYVSGKKMSIHIAIQS